MLTAVVREGIEVARFGLNELAIHGLQLVKYVNTNRYCSKELPLLPRQTCPEHKHPPVGYDSSKMETFRSRTDKVYLYVEGESAAPAAATVPAGNEAYYTVSCEIELLHGEQYTKQPDILHWFQAEPEGAVVSEFSSALG